MADGQWQVKVVKCEGSPRVFLGDVRVGDLDNGYLVFSMMGPRRYSPQELAMIADECARFIRANAKPARTCKAGEVWD